MAQQRSPLVRKFRGLMELIGGVGVTYYMGDLREDNFKNLELGPNLSIGLTYRWFNRASLRSELRVYNVGGSQVGAKRSQNNLSFRTTSADAYVGIQLDLFRYTDKTPFNAYLFGGVGLTYLNPSAVLDGKRYSLAPLQTEGVAYNRLVMIAPGGIGMTFKTTDRLSVGLELSGTYINSDYFDDVSDRFVAFTDQNSIAARLADRKPDLGLPASLPGDVRGNPGNKDIYIILTLKAQYTLKGRLGRSQLKCYMPQ